MINERRIQLTIEPRYDHFEATIRVSGQPVQEKFEIGVNHQRLQELSKSLRDNLTIGGYEFGNQIQRAVDDGGDLSKRFDWLAELGYAALGEIFPNGALGSIKEMLSTVDKPTLEILSDRFIFPWELLYDDYAPDAPINYENFWGYRYIIARQFPGIHSGYLEPEVSVSALIVGLIADNDLLHVAADELPFLKGIQSIVLREFETRNLDAKLKKEIVSTRFRSFLCAEDADVHIYHFACHTRESYSIALDMALIGEPPDQYCLWLSQANDFTLWPMDFWTHKLKFCGSPLIILNACATSPRDVRSSSSMIAQLHRFGARGVVATECPVSDAVAAFFTRLFYPLILDGMEIGEALWQARRSLLEAPYRNPFGLLYALYSPPDTRFVILSERRHDHARLK